MSNQKFTMSREDLANYEARHGNREALQKMTERIRELEWELNALHSVVADNAHRISMTPEALAAIGEGDE